MAAESAVRVIFLGDSSQAVRSVSRLEGSFATLGRTSKLVAGALGVALVGGLVLATKAAMNFQQQMELIRTQAGASQKEVDKMSAALLKMAASVGTSPEDLAKGLFHIESAGLRGTKALQVLRAAAEGSKVGMADLETVTNALVAAQTSGIKGAGSMEHAMSVLNATVGAGNMRMNDLASAIGTGILSSAKAFGLSLQDVGTAIGTMTVQGQSATQSATRLRMAFSLMAAPTAKAIGALKTIGLTQDALANTMRDKGLIAAMAELKQHLEGAGLSATQQAQVIAAAFGGGRTSGSILTLIQHVGDMQKRLEQINATTGDFGKAWIATQATVSFQMERAKAAIEAAFIPIGTLLLPLVTQLAKGVGDAAALITAHMGQIQRVAQQAAVVIGQAWNTYATPAVKGFEEAAASMAQSIRQAWPQIQATARSVGESLKSELGSTGQVIKALAPLVKALGPEFKVALGLALFAVKSFNEQTAAAMRGIAAAIRIVAPVLTSMVNEFNKVEGAVVSAAKAMAASLDAAFNSILGPIHSAISAIQTLIGWINKVHMPSLGKQNPGKPPVAPPGTPGMATGGFIAGQSGSPQLVLAHAGEVILNPMQQAAFGGAAFFKQMFGFTGGEGPGFAGGGIVNKKHPKPGKNPHRPKQPRYKSRNALANKALAAVDQINQTETDADRAYGQLGRQYQIADTDLQFIRYDANGNAYLSQPDINQRVSEIDSLIQARNHMLALLATEKKELEKAIKDLQLAIKAMLVQIKRERAEIRALAKKLSAENKKKKPNQNTVTSLQNQISAGGTRIGNLGSTISGFRTAIKDQQLNLTHQLPFDVRDVQLDIMELQQERKDDTGTTLPTSTGGGGGGTTTSTPDVQMLLNEIAQLQQALDIQGVQQSILGSFAKGTLNVPSTGPYILHAGEQIVPAGQVKGGDGATYGPITVNLSLSGPLEPLAQFITATVDSPQVADRLSVRIGQRATERARSGRF